MGKYRIEPTPDGDRIVVTLWCDALTPDHVVSIPTEVVQEAVAVARSRQLGVDARGDL